MSLWKTSSRRAKFTTLKTRVRLSAFCRMCSYTLVRALTQDRAMLFQLERIQTHLSHVPRDWFQAFLRDSTLHPSCGSFATVQKETLDLRGQKESKQDDAWLCILVVRAVSQENGIKDTGFCCIIGMLLPSFLGVSSSKVLIMTVREPNNYWDRQKREESLLHIKGYF